MTTQNNSINKTVIYLSILACLLYAHKTSAAAVSIAEEIDSLAENTEITSRMFMQESFAMRLNCLYNDSTPNEKNIQNLYDLASKTRQQLVIIEKIQQSLKNKIESGHEADWDEKYGKTGLWRKLTANIYVTSLSICTVDYYHAIAAHENEKNKILLDILTRLNHLASSISSVDFRLIKAKTTAKLALTQLAYKPAAMHQLNALAADLDVPESIRFHAAIEKIGFFGNSEIKKTDELLRKLEQSSCRDDLELILPLAFYQRKNNPAAFKKIIEIWPQTQNYLAQVILDETIARLDTRQDITAMSLFDAELAALAAWKNNPENYTTLLEKIASIGKFQTPLVLYVTAIASAETSPEKSVELLLQAASHHKIRKNARLDIEPEKIAAQAAELAYSLFLKDPANCAVAVDALDSYAVLAGEKTDCRLDYCRYVVLYNCDRRSQANQLLRKIAAEKELSPADIWHKRASLDLILQTVTQNPTESAADNATLNQLATLIADCDSDDEAISQLRTEAVIIYCQLLLEADNPDSAQKTLDCISDSEIHNEPVLLLLKSKALLQLDKYSESLKTLLDVNDQNYTGFYNHALDLLTEITENIDLLREQQKDFQQTIQLSIKLTQDCCTHLPDAQKTQAGLLLAELTIFHDTNQQEKISQLNKLLASLKQNSPNALQFARCSARLLNLQEKYEQAADAWAKIAKKLGTQPNPDQQQAYRLWQARFFELDCAANVKKLQKNNIIHSIEVLENSFQNIPPFWTQKLKSLKLRCLADITKN